jgi:NADH-quinone oxidoreductase subunit M
MEHYLSLVILTPFLAFLILLAIPSSRPTWIKVWANVGSFLGFLVALPLWFWFDRGKDFQFVEKLVWIPSIGASWHLGVDGYSLLLVLLTSLLSFLSVLSSWTAIRSRLKEYYACFLVQQAAMLGVFLALDLFLFFVFWELTLVPMYLIIGVWGGERRNYAAMKFLVYTALGGILMLLGVLILYFQHGVDTGVYTFDYFALLGTRAPEMVQLAVFILLCIGFAVKIPMWPVHTWLPDAHTEAPTAGSVILASILLKMGTYGLIRMSLPLAPDASRMPNVVTTMGVLSMIAMIYGALVSLMQTDWKKLVAYSSVSHLGFCTLGIFTLNQAGLTGSILQQINHGISTGLLFLIVGIVYERRHTREIAAYGGLSKPMPVFAILFLIAALSSMGMPPLNGFIGEFTVLRGAYQMSLPWAVAVVLAIALGAAYLIWLFQRTMLGEPAPENANLRDMTARELFVFAPLIAGVFLIGIVPGPIFDLLDRPVQFVLRAGQP